MYTIIAQIDVSQPRHIGEQIRVQTVDQIRRGVQRCHGRGEFRQLVENVVRQIQHFQLDVLVKGVRMNFLQIVRRQVQRLKLHQALERARVQRFEPVPVQVEETELPVPREYSIGKYSDRVTGQSGVRQRGKTVEARPVQIAPRRVQLSQSLMRQCRISEKNYHHRLYIYICNTRLTNGR